MRYIILFSLAIFAVIGSSQENLSARDPMLNEGKLFTIQLIPGSRKLIVSIAGKPEIELGPEQVAIFGKIISSDGKTQKLKIEASGSSFQMIDKLPPGQTIEVEVKEERAGGRKESIRLKTP